MDFTEQASSVLRSITVNMASEDYWRDSKATLAAALQAAYQAGKTAHLTEAGIHTLCVSEALACNGIVDCTGAKAVVRRVLGTLPVTADGAVAVPGSWVFGWLDDDGPIGSFMVTTEMEYDELNARWVAHYVCRAAMGSGLRVSAVNTIDLEEAYSTPQAAEAGRNNQ